MLCQAFADALDLEQIGVDEDFFSLGGDSIVAIRVVSRVRAAGYALRPRDMFAHRTVEALAPLLVETESAAAPSADGRRPDGPLAATPILRWLDDVGEPVRRSTASTRAMSLVTPADLDEDTLCARSLAATVARHHAAVGVDRAAAPQICTSPTRRPRSALLTASTRRQPAMRTARDELVAALDPAAGVMVAFGWLRGRRRARPA